jgi:hypothetical protein
MNMGFSALLHDYITLMCRIWEFRDKLYKQRNQPYEPRPVQALVMSLFMNVELSSWNSCQ